MPTKGKKTKVSENKTAAGHPVSGIDKLFARDDLFTDSFTEAVVADVVAGDVHPLDLRDARKAVKTIRRSIDRIAASLGMS